MSVGALVIGSALAGCSIDETKAAVLPTAGSPAGSGGADRTIELKAANRGAAWLNSVTLVEETEPGRLEIATTIVDPGGDAWSAEAVSAIDVCEAAVAILGEEAVAVSVFELDGSSFVLYGHPSTSPGQCTEH